MLPKSELSFDKRLVERNLKRGLMSRKDYERYLGSLPDVASKSVPLAFGQTAVDTDDEDDYDDEEED